MESEIIPKIIIVSTLLYSAAYNLGKLIYYTVFIQNIMYFHHMSMHIIIRAYIWLTTMWMPSRIKQSYFLKDLDDPDIRWKNLFLLLLTFFFLNKGLYIPHDMLTNILNYRRKVVNIQLKNLARRPKNRNHGVEKQLMLD